MKVLMMTLFGWALAFLVISGTVAQETEADPMQRLEEMQRLMHQAHQTNSLSERRALMRDHMSLMREQMQSMGTMTCCNGSMGSMMQGQGSMKGMDADQQQMMQGRMPMMEQMQQRMSMMQQMMDQMLQHQDLMMGGRNTEDEASSQSE